MQAGDRAQYDVASAGSEVAGQQREPGTGGDEVGRDGEVVDVVADVELVADFSASPGPALFHPSTAWPGTS